MTSKASTATLAVRAAIESDTQHGAVVPPLHLSSNFAFAGLGEKRQYDYTRSGNPTRDALAEALATLEGGAGDDMLTGDPPHTGSTAQAVLGKIIQGGPVSATAVRSTVPPNVDGAIRKALERLPADPATVAAKSTLRTRHSK